tara:strand:+ start:1767 stop:2792 length:1026 start_codon:yes stop_codon:yes gene_type:complete
MSSFVKEIPAFGRKKNKKTVHDRLEKGDEVNSIPGDSGLLHSGAPRKHLTFREAQNNSVIQHYGSYLVMGTDRLGHLGTGAGASGFTGADAIDIVVGRGANLETTESLAGDQPPGPAEGFIAGPLPTSDAARIYITSKSDIDKAFGLATAEREPHEGSNKHLLSGVAMKADNVRMIARNNIKIVTGYNDGYTGGKEKNSLGGDSGQAGTISLIGGNYSGDETKYMGLFSEKGAVSKVSYLQPAIKGDNLAECLSAMFTYIDKVNATLFNVMMVKISGDAAEIASPLSDPIAKAEKIRGSAQMIPYGLESSFENRAWALTQKRKYLEYGGEHHIRSPNVYLT